MDNIEYNSYENQPYFVVYECLENKCVQSSGLIRYTKKNSTEKNTDEFVRCYSAKAMGCQKLYYVSSNECSGTQSHPNESKILFTPATSTVRGVLQICMDTEGKDTGKKRLEFVKIFTNYNVENNFAMIMGQTPVFPDTVPTQKIFMKVSYNAIILQQGKLIVIT